MGYDWTPRPRSPTQEEYAADFCAQDKKSLPACCDISVFEESINLVLFLSTNCQLAKSTQKFVPWLKGPAEAKFDEDYIRRTMKMLKGSTAYEVQLVGSRKKGVDLQGSDFDFIITVPSLADIDLKTFCNGLAGFTVLPGGDDRLLRVTFENANLDLVFQGVERDISEDLRTKDNLDYFSSLPHSEFVVMTFFIRACKYWLKREKLPLRSHVVEYIARYIYDTENKKLTFTSFLFFLKRIVLAGTAKVC
jgi:hypothetical protein